MEFAVVRYDHPDATKLIVEVQREYVVRYGDEDVTPVEPDDFAPPRGRFFVGYLDGAPVACGGWRGQDGPEPQYSRGDAEIKRMYVVESVRGNGYSRALLEVIEQSARDASRKRMILETGIAQPEAMSLYESSGYHPIPRFGPYSDDPCSRCYAKALPRSA
ncbi:MAG: GNAT family N-acetyltransferase [Actinophytocola sp.]|nr:GNAT family N-acetyltransferase [Actinophytocola sp.]